MTQSDPTASGAEAIGFLPSGTGAVARTVQDVLREWVSLLQFHHPADADFTSAMAKAVAHCARTGAGLRIPAGDYAYAESPNWAVANLVVQAEGRVRFFYTGAGNALIFDAGPDDDDLCTQVQFGHGNRIHLYASAVAQNGIYLRSVHHSYVGVNVHGCGAAHAGLRTEFAVCTTFDVIVSANEGGWHQNAKPGFGYSLGKRRGAQTTSYCYFPNPVVEGVSTGIHLEHTLGNLFVGGTSEGCSNYGVLADVTAQWDRFIGTDFEVNRTADVFCQGEGVEFISCDTYQKLIFGSSAKRCLVHGGGHESINIEGGALGCSIINAVFNRRATGAAFIDAGSGTEISNVRNGVAPYTQYLSGELAVDGAAVAYRGSAVENVRVPGGKLGDFFLVSCTASMADFTIAAHCNVAGMVTVRFTNISGAAAIRPACMIKVRGIRGS